MTARTALVVLGMHRSGTSALTRVLNLMGADLPRDLLLPQHDNPDGFWESQDLQEVHDQVFRDAGATWDDFRGIPRSWFGTARVGEYARELSQVMKQGVGESSLFVLKDPRMCRLLPLWQRVFESTGVTPKYVLMLRNPMEVADSLLARNDMARERGLLLWLGYVLEAERDTRGAPRVSVTYEDLLSDWQSVITRIGSELSLEWPRSIDQVRPEVETFLKATGRHYSHDWDEALAAKKTSPWIAETCRGFLDLASGARGAGSLVELDKLRDQYFAGIENFRGLHVRFAREMNEVQGRHDALQVRLKSLGEELEQQSGHVDEVRQELESVYASRSWRITAPIRAASTVARHVLRGVSGIRRRTGQGLIAIVRGLIDALPVSADRRQAIKRAILRLAPSLPARLAGRIGTHEDTAHLLRRAFPIEPGHPESRRLPAWEFDDVGHPRVSVIIPVFNKLGHTLACLGSLWRTCKAESYEVIVVDDCSSDDTPKVLPAIRGLRYLHNPENLGFVHSCNRGALSARGRYLIFLNNDTVVQKGWMAELIRTLEEQAYAGLVGSQLINEDGTLQEAGGLIWSDATGCNIGRGQDRGRPEFNYLREVDYCSGASIAIPRDLFRELGAFDTRYAPAYYEDTDLAFKVKENGRRVLYQPLSRVLHFEGVTSGRDIESGIKRFQAVNLPKFRERWADVLKSHPVGPSAQQNALTGPRVLIVDSYTPMPDRDSGSVDAWFLMKFLLDLKCQVTFIPDDNPDYIIPYTRDLQRMGVECLYQPYLGDPREYFRRTGRHFDVVILTRLGIADRYLDSVKECCPRARIVFVTVDLHYLRARREAELKDSSRLRRQAEEIRASELAVISRADLTVLKSEEEMRLVAAELPKATLMKIPLIIDTPNREHTPYSQRMDFLFVGGFAHPPNVDAVQHFVQDIWPAVHERLPEASFLVVGSQMPESISSINEPGVEIVGYVADLSRYLNTCRVMVAPLRYGAGVKGKVGRALGYGVPCVATPIAVEGMGLQSGVNVCVADKDEAFKQRCVELYSDEKLWGNISREGLHHFEENFSVESGHHVVARLLQSLNI